MLVARNLEQIDRIEGVVTKLDLTNGSAARIGDSHRGSDDAAFV